jgi:hypothetical protein
MLEVLYMSNSQGFHIFSLDMTLEEIAKICDEHSGNPNLNLIGAAFLQVKSARIIADRNERFLNEVANINKKTIETSVSHISKIIFDASTMDAESSLKIKNSIDAYSASTEKMSGRLVFATYALVFATVILAVITALTLFKN